MPMELLTDESRWLLTFRSRAVSLERKSQYRVATVGAGNEKAALVVVSIHIVA